MMIYGCSTIEIAKEVSKVTTSVKKTIEDITSDQNVSKKPEEVVKEKEEIIVEKKKVEAAVIKQKKIFKINLLEKNINQLIQELGEPTLVRIDGNTKTVRFDTSGCRLFVYFNLSASQAKSQYYEIRNQKGALIDKNKKIEECFQEIRKI